MWDAFVAWAGSADVLVNNAGDAAAPMGMGELVEDIWDLTFQVNVKAPVILMQAPMPLMQDAVWGRIGNISSIIGVKYGGGVTTAHYSASKAALGAMTCSYAKEGAPQTSSSTPFALG